MLRCLTRFIVLVAVVILAIIFLTTSLITQVGSSLLKAFNNSAVSGFAQFIPTDVSDQNNHLQVSASGLTPNGTYHITLDNNNCDNSPIIDVGPANADSNGSFNKTYPLPKIDTSQTWYVDIHQGTSTAGTTVSCGQLIFNSNSVELQTTPLISLSPESNGEVSTPTLPGETPTTAQPAETGFPNGMPNTGVRPADRNQYDNYVYPRKY
jgi:hypothetical protein